MSMDQMAYRLLSKDRAAVMRAKAMQEMAKSFVEMTEQIKTLSEVMETITLRLDAIEAQLGIQPEEKTKAKRGNR